MCHSGGSDTSLGFDYGWKMTGCSSGTYILDTGGEITGSCEIADKITLTVECHEDKSATISWSGEGDSNVAIKVKGSHGGTLYDASSNGGGFIAGANGGGQTADISHIEVCVNCVGSSCYEEPTEPSPTASPTGSLVANPTGSPTGTHNDPPTESPTLLATCPDEQPDIGSPCGFESLDCAYDTETCCDGTEHDSFIVQCSNGVVQGHHTDACMSVVCVEPTASPTSGPTGSPVSTPTTESPTSAPTATSTQSATLPVTCPDEKPDPGSPCGFEGLDCAYGKETCCDGTDHDSFIAHPTETPTNAPTQPPVPDDRNLPTTPAPTPNKGSGSGDPHFKTWTGDKFDYHGACDLVLVDNPQFLNGLGLKLHIRTTRIKYFSYIERIALQIGSDILEFANDVDNFMINGARVEANRKHHKTKLAGFNIRRDPKAISVRLHDQSRLSKNGHNVGKIDFHTRTNGFPAVIVDGGDTSIFYGSLGLLGEWSTGRRMARDGKTELNDDDATAFALEWQVRDTEPMLFKEARFPQYPTTCTPPKKMLGNRLGSKRMRQDAEKACAHWEEDKDDCIFDVVATRSILVAAEGYIEHVQ
ncbi:expressed unknown protein [Seminavis robusta]|uniref:VWFD domain-containing protein n=1 Tax=Seminavis robusta TaxID=568900 RepID=A0A9N8HNC9_9STRA|nr:expressed unknown protein [Seminavis robusta]|eukprot:Sro1199_g251750.1 n/a (588) ;mRNA; f:16673-18773